MKSILKLVLFSVLITGTLACTKSKKRSAGPGTSGGGSFTEAIFREYGENLLDKVEKLDDLLVGEYKVDVKLLRSKLKVAKIKSTKDKLVLNNVEKDALNDISDNSILVNILRWDAACEPLKELIVLHELLGLTRSMDNPEFEPDKNYVVSRTIIERVYGKKPWGTNCSPYSYISLSPSEDQKSFDKVIDIESIKGTWVGHMELRGLGENEDQEKQQELRQKWHSCFEESHDYVTKERYLDYDFEFFLNLEMHGEKFRFVEGMFCALNIRSKVAEIGTVVNDHQGRDVVSPSKYGDSLAPLRYVKDGKVFLTLDDREFLLGHLEEDRFVENFEDRLIVEIQWLDTNHIIYSERREVAENPQQFLEIRARAIRLDYLQSLALTGEIYDNSYLPEADQEGFKQIVEQAREKRQRIPLEPLKINSPLGYEF